MLPLIPWTFGNRRPDIFGNVHVRWNRHGRPKFRDPGNYVGRHRAHAEPGLLRMLAKLAGERV